LHCNKPLLVVVPIDVVNVLLFCIITSPFKYTLSVPVDNDPEFWTIFPWIVKPLYIVLVALINKVDVKWLPKTVFPVTVKLLFTAKLFEMLLTLL